MRLKYIGTSQCVILTVKMNSDWFAERKRLGPISKTLIAVTNIRINWDIESYNTEWSEGMWEHEIVKKIWW